MFGINKYAEGRRKHNKKVKVATIVALAVIMVTFICCDGLTNKGKSAALQIQLVKLKREQESATFDSLHSRGLYPNWIEQDIDYAQQSINDLKEEAFQPLMKKYPLSKFFTNAQLDSINYDVAERALNADIDISENATYTKNLKNILDWYAIAGYIGDNELTANSDLRDLIVNMELLASMESADQDSDIKIPNENPLVTRKINGWTNERELVFRDAKAVDAYEKFRSEYDDRDKLYIYKNTKYAPQMAKYAEELNRAYERREEVRKISDFFANKYSDTIFEIKRQLKNLEEKKR